MDNTFLHNKKLLLVDDEPELLKMITAILTDEGFQYLVTAPNMKEGIAAAKAEKPDLAILDVMLPDGDGFSLMRQIRTWTDIPVIFLTARDEAVDKLEGLGLGADDYIAKPFLPGFAPLLQGGRASFEASQLYGGFWPGRSGQRQ